MQRTKTKLREKRDTVLRMFPLVLALADPQSSMSLGINRGKPESRVPKTKLLGYVKK
jgi:hypothetical protein